MKKWTLSLVALLSALVLVACGSKKADTDKWSTYEENKSITIGFDNTFVPMGFEDEKGNTVGFDVELAEAVFDKYGIKVKWQPIDWGLKEQELQKGKIDLIWNGYSATDERRAKVAFTNPYMDNQQVLVSKKSSQIDQVSQMKGKKLGAQTGSSGYTVFEEQPEKLKNIVDGKDAVTYATFTEALMDLKNDRIDGLLIDRVYANYYLKEEGSLKDYNIVDAGFESESFAVGTRKADKTLVDKINAAFKELYKEGKFQEISQKWFGEDVATDVVKK